MYTRINMTQKEIKLTLASYRYSVSAIEDKLDLRTTSKIEPGSHNEEAIEALTHTLAIYLQLIKDIENIRINGKG